MCLECQLVIINLMCDSTVHEYFIYNPLTVTREAICKHEKKIEVYIIPRKSSLDIRTINLAADAYCMH